MLGYSKLSRLPTGTKVAVENSRPRIYGGASEDDALPANFHELFPNFCDIRSRKTLMEIAFVRKRMFILAWMKSTDDNNNISVKGAQALLGSYGITENNTSSGNWNDWLQVIQECIVELNGTDAAPPSTRLMWPGALQMLTSKLAHLLPTDDADEVSTAEVPYATNPNSNNTVSGQRYDMSVHTAADDPRNSRLTSNETVITTSTSGTSKYDILASILHSNEVKHSFYGSPEREESPVVTPSLTDVHSPDQPDEAPTSKLAAQNSSAEAEQDGFLEESEHSTLEILEWSNGLNGFRKATPLTYGSPIRDFRFLHPYNKQLFPPTGSNADVIGHPSSIDHTSSTGIGSATTGVHHATNTSNSAIGSAQSTSRGSSPARATPVLWKAKSSPERADPHAVHHSLPTILEFSEGAGSQKSVHHTIFAAGLQSITEIQERTSAEDAMTGKVADVPAHEPEMETQTCDFNVEDAPMSLIIENNTHRIISESVMMHCTQVTREATVGVNTERRANTVSDSAEILLQSTIKSSSAGTTEAPTTLIFPNTEFIPLPPQPSASAEADGDAVSVTSALTNVSREEVRRMAHLLASKKVRRPAAGLARRKHTGTAGSRRSKASTTQRDNSAVDDSAEDSAGEPVPETVLQSIPPVMPEPSSASIPVEGDVVSSPVLAPNSVGSPKVVHGTTETISDHHGHSHHRGETSPVSRTGSLSRSSPARSPPRHVHIPAEFPAFEEPAPSGSWGSLRIVLVLLLYVSLLVAGRQYYQQHFPSIPHRSTRSGSAGPSRNAENVADPTATFQHHHRAPAEHVDSFWSSGASNVHPSKYDHAYGAARGPDVGTLSLIVSYQPPSRFGTASSGSLPDGAGAERSEAASNAKASAGPGRDSRGAGTGTVANAHFTPLGAFRQAWSKLKGLLKFGLKAVTRPVSSIFAIFGRRS